MLLNTKKKWTDEQKYTNICTKLNAILTIDGWDAHKTFSWTEFWKSCLFKSKRQNGDKSIIDDIKNTYFLFTTRKLDLPKIYFKKCTKLNEIQTIDGWDAPQTFSWTEFWIHRLFKRKRQNGDQSINTWNYKEMLIFSQQKKNRTNKKNI